MNFFDWLNSITAKGTTAFQGLGTLVISIIALFAMAKVHFRVATCIVVGVMAGLALFFVWGGGTVIKGMFQNTIGS